MGAWSAPLLAQFRTSSRVKTIGYSFFAAMFKIRWVATQVSHMEANLLPLLHFLLELWNNILSDAVLFLLGPWLTVLDYLCVDLVFDVI
jgi:hypothetical protein